MGTSWSLPPQRARPRLGSGSVVVRGRGVAGRVGGVGHHAAMTDDEKTALAIEAQWWRYQGAKEAHIRDALGWSAVRHAQVVNALIDRADVEAAEPMVVRRLRRIRERRRAVRSGRL